MAEQYIVRIVDTITGEESVSDPSFSDVKAADWAEHEAERLTEYLAERLERATGFKKEGWLRYVVWFTTDTDDEAVAYVVTVEEQEVDEDGA